MFDLSQEAIDSLSEDQQRELLAWLRDLVTYVETKLGVLDAGVHDPIMERIIADHKQQQRKIGRIRPSWMSVAYEKTDDRHV